jgi:Secretion system C-terminal sorting domain/SprB repeat/Ig-like domain CHU_C associated
MNQKLYLLVFMLCSFCNWAQTYSGGTGTAQDPFLIANKNDLKYLSDNSSQWGLNFRQTANIVFTTADFEVGGQFYNGGLGFSPIGNVSTYFQGKYNGNGFTIENLKINRPNQNNVGLFGYTVASLIRKLGLKNVNITGESYVGGIAGIYLEGTLNECYATGSVSGVNYVGGIFGGVGYSNVNNCYSTVNVPNYFQTSSFIGYPEETNFLNCYAVTTLTNNGPVFFGYGGATNSIISCYYDSQTSGTTINNDALPKTTLEMKTQSTFTDWDFTGETTNGTNDIWKAIPYPGAGYPILAWQTETYPANVNPPTASAQSLCAGATVANLVATGENGATFNWYNVATGGTALTTTTALSTGTYYVSQTVSGQESTRTSVAVTVNPVLTNTFSQINVFCNGGSTGSATVTPNGGTSPYTYLWSNGGTTATITGLTAGTYTCTITDNANCTKQQNFTISQPTAISSSIASQTNVSCFGGNNGAATVSVTGGVPNYTYSWSPSGGNMATATGLSAGTYTCNITDDNGCTKQQSVIITEPALVMAPTAQAQSFCGSATVANLTANGTNLKWYPTSAGGTSIASGTMLMSGTYFVSQTVNGCESTRTMVSVTVNTLPNAPTALAQTFCSIGNTPINLLVASGENGATFNWYDVATAGTALDSNYNMASGTYYVSQTVNGCESGRTSVEVTINLAPNTPVASYQEFCQGATVNNLQASGSNRKWYNTVGGTPLALNTILVSGIYFVTASSDEGCESSPRPFPVQINSLPESPTASAQSFCNGATIADIVVTTGNGLTIKWFDAATDGNQLDDTTLLTTGTYYVAQNNGTCDSERVAVSITINNPTGPTAAAQSFCGSATVANLVATGEANATFNWYDVSELGTVLTTTTTLANGTYYVSQTVNGCESARTSVAVTINTIPVAPTANMQTLCSNSNPTVDDLLYTGIANATFKVFDVALGGNELPFSTVLVSGIYYVSQTVNGCESTRTSFSVTLTTPTEPTAQAQTFCSTENATVANLVATGINRLWYATNTSNTSLESTVTLITGTYYVSQTINGCESPRTAVSVTIKSIADAPTSIEVNNLTLGAMSTYTFNYRTGCEEIGNNSFNSNIFRVRLPAGYPSFVAFSDLIADNSSNIEVKVNGVVVPINTVNFNFITSTAGIIQISVKSYLIPQESNVSIKVSNIITNPSILQSYTFNWNTARGSGAIIENFSNKVDFLVLSNNSFDNNTNLKVYPNPSSSVFTVDIDGNATIEVYDLVGKQIVRKNVASGTSQLDLSNFSKGVYLFKVTNQNNQTKNIKIIKE